MMQAEVNVLDVGQGDCIVALAPNGRALLIDCPPQGVPVALDFLEQKHILEIELAVLSHSDIDHMGGLVDILRNFQGRIRYLLFNFERPFPKEGHKKRLRELKAVCDRRGITVLRPNTGFFDRSDLSGMSVEVLGPDGSDGLANMAGDLSQNDVSIVLRIEYLGGRVILGADVGRRGWEAIIRRVPDLRADVLKFPHHGAWHRGLPSLLQAIQPNYALISVGTDGRYRHPRPQTLRLLKQLGITVICTEVTRLCESNLPAVRAQAAAMQTSTIGLSMECGQNCACGGTITVVLDGQVHVSPDRMQHEAVKRLLTSPGPQCEADTA